MDGYYLVVQEERKLSDYIAEKTNVKHESPQAFYFIDGEATWNASHSDINVSSLAQVKNNNYQQLKIVNAIRLKNSLDCIIKRSSDKSERLATQWLLGSSHPCRSGQ